MEVDSSVLLVDGNLINRPFGFKSSREIMSAISINDNLNHEKIRQIYDWVLSLANKTYAFAV